MFCPASAQNRMHHVRGSTSAPLRNDGDDGMLISQNILQFGFLKDLPWCLWETRDQCRAVEVHTMYETMKSSGWSPDRVSVWWMEESELARQFRVHRQGGGIGPLLEEELSTLECLVLDGTCGEEMHGLYARIGRSAASASYRYKASTHRLHQN